MTDLDNSTKQLTEGLVYLFRDEIGDGSNAFSTNSEYNVPNVWSKNVPKSAEEEFPRGTVDVISGNDFELSVDLGVRLREVTVKFVVFGKGNGIVETLIDDIEETVETKWDIDNPDTNSPYLGDWSFRETDGFTELNESGEQESDLRYSRSLDCIFEVVRHD
jgi:hypothetical protein